MPIGLPPRFQGGEQARHTGAAARHKGGQSPLGQKRVFEQPDLRRQGSSRGFQGVAQKGGQGLGRPLQGG